MSDMFILNEEKKKKTTPVYEFKNSMWWIEKINRQMLAKQALKVQEKVVFFRLLSTMLNAWITLSKWVSILEAQEKKLTVLKIILQKFEKELREWKWLSDCMRLFPNSFNNAEVWVVESWEKTGKLNISLRDLADQTEKLNSINGKLKSALIYPAVIILVVIWVIIVLMVAVVPKLVELFDGTAQLPLPTRMLIWTSDLFLNYWWIMLAVTIVLVGWLWFWKKTAGGKYHRDRIVLWIPIVGNIVQKIALSKFARVLSGMLKSGVSIVESLRITSDAVWNEVYRQRIIFLRDDIKRGLKIYESLEWDPLFPEMMVSMIQIGEQTAKVDEIILKVADFYDEEVDNVIGAINKILEPVIIVILAVIVWIIALAIMLPIINLTEMVEDS